MTSLRDKLRAALEFGEIPTKFAMRSGLVNKMVSGGLNALSREELAGLHQLDSELCGINAVETFVAQHARTADVVNAMIEVCAAAEAFTKANTAKSESAEWFYEMCLKLTNLHAAIGGKSE